MNKELKETKRMEYEQTESINKETEITKWNQIENLELKNTTPEMNN